ncbi:MAG: hypothetical protein BJ554DRAFT_5493 [Olpidium bornovanus]|uniref:Uncharacterized protein n=1 Tax=Olpidium bornovanus TaxID=278681 RepID=A0A8H7ZZ52_9FUNG|nr:MAG: hypothetical protein BJ554DRAFT_5493 [Olpidium bornovanus]
MEELSKQAAPGSKALAIAEEEEGEEERGAGALGPPEGPAADCGRVAGRRARSGFGGRAPYRPSPLTGGPGKTEFFQKSGVPIGRLAPFSPPPPLSLSLSRTHTQTQHPPSRAINRASRSGGPSFSQDIARARSPIAGPDAHRDSPREDTRFRRPHITPEPAADGGRRQYTRPIPPGGPTSPSLLPSLSAPSRKVRAADLLQR